jgi:hypothetical protein
MGKPFLSCIVPTVGRVTLEPLLRSLREQTHAGETELLVVGDTHAGTWRRALESVPALCDAYAARYAAYDGGVHAWGHPQRNYGASLARGAWLWWLQDDDLPADDAYATLRRTLWDAPRVPHLFQTATWQAGTVWREPVLALRNIDADCLVAPNAPTRLAPWPPTYNGDFTAICETVALYGGRCVWVPAVIAHGRPAGVPADLQRRVYA